MGRSGVAAVIANLLLSELTFTAGHWTLHQTVRGGQWHALHHACRPCSWSSNLLFHPVDLLIEFSGPFLALAGSHCLLFDDRAALLVSVHLLHLWYALDHSENWRLAHYRHHLYVDSTYTIYCGRAVRVVAADTVKPLLTWRKAAEAKLVSD
jgi:sterol desaturase/sphingolipid hydroxylase (fatty acid hydroxylase superfamily)